MTLDDATDVFVNGFSFIRSFTHPYEVTKTPPIWVMADAPRRSGDYRRTEVVTWCTDPKEVRDAIRRERLGRYALCVLTPTVGLDEGVKRDFKLAGYRFLGTEGFFDRELSGDCGLVQGHEARIFRVDSREELERVSQAAGGREMLPEHLTESPARIRLYAAEMEGKIVGRVRSIKATQKGCWVAGLSVLPEYRRRGIARALMSRMLSDDRESTATHSVLLASHAGALLYPLLGYRRIGTLHMFTPVNRNEVGQLSPNRKES